MKYRNYRYIVNTQNAARPMLALDVTELDYDPELLNTPEATYDLTKGTKGGHPHDPDDLITKITACSPGNKGKDSGRRALTCSSAMTGNSSAMYRKSSGWRLSEGSMPNR